MDKELKDALLATEAFDAEDLELLDVGEEANGPIVNWSQDKFAEIFGSNAAKRIVAHQTVSMFKSGPVIEAGADVEIPDFPPYLARGQGGVALGYDPHDPSQYWTSPFGEMFRWDGKRGTGGERSEVTKEQAPRNPYPHGKPKRVTVVRHRAFDGVLIPDEQEAHDANAAGLDWFHRGYNCWVGDGGKPYGEVAPDVRQRFLAARDRLAQQGRRAPLINRSRSVREVAA